MEAEHSSQELIYTAISHTADSDNGRKINCARLPVDKPEVSTSELTKLLHQLLGVYDTLSVDPYE